MNAYNGQIRLEKESKIFNFKSDFLGDFNSSLRLAVKISLFSFAYFIT